jgi:hypothetical protein
MFTSVHSSAGNMQYVSMSLDCAILSRPNRSFEANSQACLTSQHMRVPFKGVVARGPIGGVCPSAVHSPEPHFSAVSDKGRERARTLLRSIFAPCVHVASVSRSALDRAEMRAVASVRAWGAELCSDVFWLCVRN